MKINISLIASMTVGMIGILPFSTYAIECKEVVAKLPDYTQQQSPLAGLVNTHIANCQNRPNANDSAALDICIKAGMNSLAISGNYVAAEMLAKIYCEQNNEEMAKRWMKVIVNTPTAPQSDRELLEQALAE